MPETIVHNPYLSCDDKQTDRQTERERERKDEERERREGERSVEMGNVKKFDFQKSRKKVNNLTFRFCQVIDF